MSASTFDSTFDGAEHDVPGSGNRAVHRRTESERNATKQRRVNRLERRWWTRAAVNLFIGWHLFALAIWLLPSNSAIVQSPVGVGLVRPYMTMTGFAQSWNMFAPYPDKLDVTLEARITYADGEVRSWYFPRMARMGYAERYERQRWRKIVEVATHGSTRVIWGSLARYAARVNNFDSQNRPVSVALFQHSRVLPPPGLGIPPMEVQPAPVRRRAGGFSDPPRGPAMKALQRDWNEFWFRPVSSVPLGLFRLLFGALVLAYGLLLYPERFAWFSNRGILSAADALAYNGMVGPGTQRLNLLFQPGADRFLTPLLLVFLLAAFCLMVGLWTRAGAIVVYLGLCLLHARNAPIHDSGDTVMMVLSAYLVLSPAGAACSVDRLQRVFQGKEDETPPRIVPWAQRLIQIQMAVLYLCASFAKVTGPEWMNGTAVYFPLHLPESARFPMLGRDNIYVINLMTWGTIAVEMALATFVWVPRLRLYVLALGVLLHLGIEYTFNIPLFSFLMITAYLTFLKGSDIENFLAWSKRLLALTPLRLVYDGECDFCKSSLLVVRFLDVFRMITFVDSHDRAALATTGVRFEDAEEAAYAVRPDGKQFAGFDAFRQVAWQLPLTAFLAPLLYVPGVPQLGRRAYTWIKDNRSRLPVAARYKAKPAQEEPRTPVGV